MLRLSRGSAETRKDRPLPVELLELVLSPQNALVNALESSEQYLSMTDYHQYCSQIQGSVYPFTLHRYLSNA